MLSTHSKLVLLPVVPTDSTLLLCREARREARMAATLFCSFKILQPSEADQKDDFPLKERFHFQSMLTFIVNEDFLKTHTGDV